MIYFSPWNAAFQLVMASFFCLDTSIKKFCKIYYILLTSKHEGNTNDDPQFRPTAENEKRINIFKWMFVCTVLCFPGLCSSLLWGQ